MFVYGDIQGVDVHRDQEAPIRAAESCRVCVIENKLNIRLNDRFAINTKKKKKKKKKERGNEGRRRKKAKKESGNERMKCNNKKRSFLIFQEIERSKSPKVR